MNRKFFVALLLTGIVCRVALLTHYEWVNGGEVDVYLADEGIVGLMGKHILEGRALPVFFYGQHYLGALEAYLAALSFAVFGISLFALRLVPFTASLALLWAVYTFTEKVYSRAAARWATSIVAVAPMYFLQWNLKARGGFVEHVLLLFVIMILLWRYLFDDDRRPLSALRLGLVAGVAFWVNQLLLAYLLVLVPVFFVDRARPRRWPQLLVGFLLGASLLIGYNVVHPLATFRTLARKSVTLNRVPVSERDEHWLARGIGKRLEALSQGADKIGMIFGVPPRAEVAHLGLSKNVRKGTWITRLRQGLAFIPLLFFGAGLIAFRLRRVRGSSSWLEWNWRAPNSLLFLFFAATFLVGYVSPRYMLPAYPIAAVMSGAWISQRSGKDHGWMVAGLALVLVYNLLGWADTLAAAGTGSTRRVKTLVEALETKKLSRCYSAGPMYHAMFASHERIIMSPLQKDRYPAYGQTVREAENICYIFRDDQNNKRQHKAFLSLLAEKHIDSRRIDAGVYSIMYDFRPRQAITEADMELVRHQEKMHIGLGQESAD